ncbi:hypothetical protein R83H12_00726 [Fibrobacteria bacterium R8-3-H12]
MPSLRVLFAVLFLVALALFIVIVFMNKSKPILDAQSYAEQHPNCNEIKIHSKKNDLIECFSNYESLDDIPLEPLGADTLYIPMAKLIGERFPQEFPLRIKHIFSFPDRTEDSIWISGSSITITKNKNSVWRNKNGCRFLAPCPVMPLKGSAISKKEAKEDYIYSAEQIFKNKFSATGKAPVNAILPGKILDVEQDSLFSITIYHGENIYTKTSGLYSIDSCAQIGNIVSTDITLGYLPPKSTAFIFVEITRNGKYETWANFYAESRATVAF